MSAPLRVLLVEDNLGDADLIREFLPREGPVSFEVGHATRLATAVELVGAEHFDLILLDLGLPDCAGLDTVRAMRRQAPDLPIVVLTANDDERAALVAIQEGAQDYVVKGQVTGAFLARVLAYAQERHQSSRRLLESEEQLHQSQKMEAIGQLAGGIAHDFNNLLTAVIGYSELLLVDPELAGPSAQEDLREILHAAERATALTRQILAFSRRQTLRPTVASLNDVLAGMEPLLRRTLGENIDVVTLQHPDLGHAEIDVHQFEQVLMNLALNARDAMSSGGRLTLETANVELDEEYCSSHPEATSGSCVMLAVSDTGVGMDEATLQHAFEPFFTTKPPGQGTGLGLATVYGIVRQSNGSICVYSERGKGTSFKIYLRRVDASVQVESLVTVRAAPTGGDETILVVEDEGSIRNLVARVLGDLGYGVLLAGSGAEALEVVMEADCQVDLLLTDVVLPGGMQGSDLARDLLASRPELLVLFMSGYTRNAIVHAGRLDERVNFLEKPFTPVALATMVRTVLDQTRSSR